MKQNLRIIKTEKPDRKPVEADSPADESAEKPAVEIAVENPVETGEIQPGNPVENSENQPLVSGGKIEFPATFSNEKTSTRQDVRLVPGEEAQVIEFKRKPAESKNKTETAGKLSDLLAAKWTFKAGKPPWPTGLYEINPKGRSVVVGTGKSAVTVTGYQYLRRITCPGCKDRRVRVAGYLKPVIVAEMQRITKEETIRYAAFKILADWRKPMPNDLQCAGCVDRAKSETGKAG